MRALVTGSAAILRLIGLRYLRYRWRRTALTGLGVAAGVALVFAIGITHATLEHAIGDTELGATGANSLTVEPSGVPSLAQDAATIAARTPGVIATTSAIRQTSRVAYRNTSIRTVFVATSSNGARSTGARLAPEVATPGSLFLSAALARQLSARIGSFVAVETPNGPAKLRVTAVVRSSQGGAVNGGVYAVVALPLAQRLFARAVRLDALVVQVRHDVPRDRVRKALARALGPTARVGTAEQLAAPFRRTFETLTATTRLVSLLAVMVAVLLVLNTQGMALTERHRELCLLRLGGAEPHPILIAFVAEAVVIGLVGGAVGVVAGMQLAHAGIEHAHSAYAGVLPFTAAGPVALSLPQALGGVACGAVIAAAGALLTIRRIFGAQPIELLRPKPAYALVEPQAGRAISMWGVVGVAAIVGAVLLVAARPAGAPVGLDVVALLVVVAGGALVLASFVRVTSTVLTRHVLTRLGPVGWLAGTGIVRARSRTIFAVGALALGATVALAAGSAIGSFKQDTRLDAGRWYPMAVYVHGHGVGALRADQPVGPDVGRRLATVPGVRAAYPMRTALISSDRDQTVILALPFADAAREGETVFRTIPATDSRLIAALASGSVVVSRPLATRLRLSRGRTVALTTAYGPRRFSIVRVIDSVNPTGEVYMDRSVYQRVMDDDRVDAFGISVAKDADVADTVDRLKRFVAAQRIPVDVSTRDQVVSRVLASVDGVFALANVIRLSALVIAALTVVSTMLTAMSEREGELGLLRLVGMSRMRLASSALTETTCTAGMASVLAIGLGLSLGYVILAIAQSTLGMRLDFRPSVAMVASAMACTVIPACIVTLYASARCTRPAITDLLRPRG